MRVDLNEKIKTELETLKKEGTYKRLKYNTGILHGKIPVEGWGQQIVLCSNNYLGLADNEEVLKAAHEALDTYGAGASNHGYLWYL